MDYKDCKYNTSEVSSFVGYCSLPKYKSEYGQRLVKCCKRYVQILNLRG